MFYNQFTFVLVETSHPGNIGAAARAIKTMGFSNLTLVNPKNFPADEASSRAAGAVDILESASVVQSLDEAISDCHLVIGTSVRDRSVAWPTQSPREMAHQVCERYIENENSNDQLKIAIVFGRERTGLENSELDKTQIQVRIPANPDYSSLNLASAVQLLAYELNATYMQQSGNDQQQLQHQNQQQNKDVASSGKHERQRLATIEELQGYYEHLVQVLEKIDFTRESPPTKLMRKIVRLYNRSSVSIEELNILRGMLSAIDKTIDKK